MEKRNHTIDSLLKAIGTDWGKFTKDVNKDQKYYIGDCLDKIIKEFNISHK